MSKYRILAFFTFSVCTLVLAAQDTTKTTQWIDYFSYKVGYSLGKVKGKVYCASTNAIFYYNTTDNSVNRLSKVNRLSDVSVSAMACNPDDNTTVVGYQDGNIDILQDEQTVNVVDLKSKQISTSKTVNDIAFYNNKALLATDFGILLLDYKNGQFADTYTFNGDDGYVAVNRMYVDPSTAMIYAATESGIYTNNLGNSNIADFESWKKISAMGSRDFNAVCYHAGQILANTSVWIDGVTYDSLFVYKNSTCSLFPKSYYAVTRLRKFGDKLYIVNHASIDIYDGDMSLKDVIDSNEVKGVYLTDVLPDDDGTLWISDINNGLIHSTNYKASAPDGPANDVISDIAYQDNTLYLTHGWPYSYNYSRVSFYYFEVGGWYSNLDWVSYDPVKIALIPDEPGRYFVGTCGYGMFEGDSWWNISHHYFRNSYFDSYKNDASMYVNITNIVSDTAGNIYSSIADVGNGKRFYMYSNQKKWYSWTYPEVKNPIISSMIIDKNNYKWCGLDNTTIFVFDENGTPGNTSDDKTAVIPIKDASGEEISQLARCLFIDKDDVLWVGTGTGLAYYPSASSIFSDESPTLSRNKVEVEGVVDYILSSESIYAIVADAANRKWVGTGTGVYLVSSDGTQVLDHLTASNSPLPSDFITSLEMIPERSLLLIGTKNGLIGYNIGIKVASSDLESVSVYPNPVKHEHTGTITIENLMGNTVIKIMDVNGNLVHKAVSEGGISYWDGNNLEGRRVATGVYFIVCTSEDNSQKNVVKLVFIN